MFFNLKNCLFDLTVTIRPLVCTTFWVCKINRLILNNGFLCSNFQYRKKKKGRKWTHIRYHHLITFKVYHTCNLFYFLFIYFCHTNRKTLLYEISKNTGTKEKETLKSVRLVYLLFDPSSV